MYLSLCVGESVSEPGTIGLCWPPPIVVPLVPIVLAASYCAELTNGNCSPEGGGARPQCPSYTIVLQRCLHKLIAEHDLFQFSLPAACSGSPSY